MSETDTKPDDILGTFLARQAAIETVLTHFLIKLSQRMDADSRLINDVMIAAEADIIANHRSAPEKDRQIADEALAYFQDYSGRLIAAMTPRNVRN